MSLPFDASIPVLTEVFQKPAEPDAPHPAADPAAGAAADAAANANAADAPEQHGWYATILAPDLSPEALAEAAAELLPPPDQSIAPGAPPGYATPAARPAVGPAMGPIAVPGPAPAGAYSVPVQAALGSNDWAQLERRLAEGVLLQLQGRIDSVLEQALRDSIAAVLHEAVAGLAGEIRAGLQQTVEHIVSRAVAQELAQLQAASSSHG